MVCHYKPQQRDCAGCGENFLAINPNSRHCSLECRFWTKVNKSGPAPDYNPELGLCWLWTGAKIGEGYGTFKIKGRDILAHRFSYKLSIGEIPNGMQIDHLCRVRCCVNPAHLDVVTNAENMRRGLRGMLTTHCPRGHPYSGDNLRVGSRGQPFCRTCDRERSRRRYWEKKGSTAVFGG